MKKVIIFILFLTSNNFSFAVEHDSLVIKYKSEMTYAIKQQLKDNSKFDINYIQVQSIPTFYLNIHEDKTNNVYYDLIIDTTLGYALLKENSNTVGVARKHYFNYNFNESERETEVIAQVSKANQFSNNPFFVYFLNDEKNWQNIIGFFKNGKLCFMTKDLVLFNSINDIINEKYGCNKKYFELVEIEKAKEKELLLINDSLEYAKSILRNSYRWWGNTFPHDTVKVLNLFIDELDNYVGLFPMQKKILLGKIYSRISSINSNNYNGAGIPFFSEEISFEVKSVLTSAQYANYLKKSELNSWIITQASKKIYLTLRKENNALDSLIDRSMIKEILIDNLR